MSPYDFNSDLMCDIKGLICLKDIDGIDKLIDNCYPTCTEMEIKNVAYYEEDSDFAQVTIHLINKPTLRYVSEEDSFNPIF